MLEGRLLLILSHAHLSFGPQYYQRLLDTICCHLVAGRVRDQEVGLSGKQSATTALHDTDTGWRFCWRKAIGSPIRLTIVSFHTLTHWRGLASSYASPAWRFVSGRGSRSDAIGAVSSH